MPSLGESFGSDRYLNAVKSQDSVLAQRYNLARHGEHVTIPQPCVLIVEGALDKFTEILALFGQRKFYRD